jgi:hypothetical protein
MPVYPYEYVSGAIVLNDPDEGNPTTLLAHVSNVGWGDQTFRILGFAATIESGPGPDPRVFQSEEITVPAGVTAYYRSRLETPETPGPYWVRIMVTSLHLIPSFDFRRHDAEGFSRTYFRFQPGEFAVHKRRVIIVSVPPYPDSVGDVFDRVRSRFGVRRRPRRRP